MLLAVPGFLLPDGVDPTVNKHVLTSRAVRDLLMAQLRDVSHHHPAGTKASRPIEHFPDSCRMAVPTCHILMGDRSQLSTAVRASPKSHEKPLKSFQLA